MRARGQPQPDVHRWLQHAEVLQSSAADLMPLVAPCIMALLPSSITMLQMLGSLPIPASSLAIWDYFSGAKTIWCPS